MNIRKGCPQLQQHSSKVFCINIDADCHVQSSSSIFMVSAKLHTALVMSAILFAVKLGSNAGELRQVLLRIHLMPTNETVLPLQAMYVDA